MLFDSGSPRIAAELGIRGQDWRELHELISKQPGSALIYVERNPLGSVGAWLATKTTDGLEKRGPVFFYAKHQGRWHRLDELSEWKGRN